MDSKSIGRNPLRVRVSLPAQYMSFIETIDKQNLAYVIGVAIGDGNLSNPNGRATRLRVTCDNKYPNLQKRIVDALRKLLPDNKVNTIIRPRNCTDVYVFSNKLEALLGWQAVKGSKYKQRVCVPSWIKNDKNAVISCLKGLFETDGSVYIDRGYKMAIFTTIIPTLAQDVVEMINAIEFQPHCYLIKQEPLRRDRYNIRISKNAQEFIDIVGINKS